MNAREQAEQRALELYPPSQSVTLHIFHSNCRQAYLKGWEEAQDIKLRESAEKVVEYWKMNPSLVDDWERDMDISVEELEKELK